jgi:hypothetical protein
MEMGKGRRAARFGPARKDAINAPDQLAHFREELDKVQPMSLQVTKCMSIDRTQHAL